MSNEAQAHGGKPITPDGETKMKIEKLHRVECTDEELKTQGIVAFQLVRFGYSFYGQDMTDVLDTKIMQDGSQIVIDGNGFIKAGHPIA